MQLGFTAYNAIDRPIESLFAVNEITSGTNPIAGVLNNSNGVESFDVDAEKTFHDLHSKEIIISTLNRRKSIRSAEPILISGKKVVKVTAVGAVNNLSQFVAFQKPLESTIIKYPRAMLAGSESENYQSSVRAVPKSEKKSFVSKSVSVLKKPYDWLKVIASRIN